MKILHLIILDKLYEKRGFEEMQVRDIKEHLTIIHRIPKQMQEIIIADMINNNELVKVAPARYRLRKDVKKRIDSNVKKYNLIRNNTFLS